MSGSQIKVGGRTFPSKAAAEEALREILYRYPLGRVPLGDDHDFLVAAVDNHPSAELKRGTGIAYFLVRSHLYGTRAFFIQRTDGSITDFSFRKCVDKNLSAPRASLLQALRAEVNPDIADFKSQWFDMHGDEHRRIKCPVSGDMIGFDEAHADHMPPFEFIVLATCWIAARGITPGRGLVTTTDMQPPSLTDRDLAAHWITFHHSLARFQIVAWPVNLARSAACKIPKGGLSLRKPKQP